MSKTEDLLAALGAADTVQAEGRVTALVGLAVRARVPGIRSGELVEIHRTAGGPLLAEVVGFEGDEATLMPFGASDGTGPGDRVTVHRKPFSIVCSDSLLGRVVDAMGAPIDGKGPVKGTAWSVMRAPPNPMERKRIEKPLALGIRVIDGLLTVGEGQRMGLFAGSGVGKSTLLGQIAKGSDADVFVVCLIGERGREVREFVDDTLGEGLSRGVVVCATSDAPALLRLKSAYTATAIAEYFRDQGKRVALLMDSVTRFARAGREVGLAAGEPPARRGYPPSVFAALPALLERSGHGAAGSITAFYTVLVEGDDLDEPVADEVRGTLDGHIVLSRELGARGHYPAVDVLQSLSRVMPKVASKEHLAGAQRVRELLATYEEKRDLVTLGAYKPGSDARLDEALAKIDEIHAFLRQDAHSVGSADLDQTVAGLLDL